MMDLDYKGLHGMSYDSAQKLFNTSMGYNNVALGLGASESPFIMIEQGQTVHRSPNGGVWIGSKPKPRKHWSLRLIGFIARCISIPFSLFDSKEPDVKVLSEVTKEL